ncbi:recombinase family protein [Nonomuraea diastatica]|uniref:recombinase family protein n=1 Tax=Nonomuraea diastatica TaxID=1848329 RepID=UPI001C708089|nr:recombinase family protein [Nonomuraea diastatica]
MLSVSGVGEARRGRQLIQIRIFADKKSGENAEPEELWKALDRLRPGDTLVVSFLDRLGRFLQDLIATAE